MFYSVEHWYKPCFLSNGIYTGLLIFLVLNPSFSAMLFAHHIFSSLSVPRLHYSLLLIPFNKKGITGITSSQQEQFPCLFCFHGKLMKKPKYMWDGGSICGFDMFNFRNSFSLSCRDQTKKESRMTETG